MKEDSKKEYFNSHYLKDEEPNITLCHSLLKHYFLTKFIQFEASVENNRITFINQKRIEEELLYHEIFNTNRTKESKYDFKTKYHGNLLPSFGFANIISDSPRLRITIIPRLELRKFYRVIISFERKNDLVNPSVTSTIL